MLDEEFNLKLADFGFASVKAKNKTGLGTEGYMAPEIYEQQEYSGKSVDMFAAGVILFTMVARHPPFRQAVSENTHYKLITCNRADLFWGLHTKKKEGGLAFFSEEFMNLITQLLACDPVQRPSLSEVKAHPWYTGPVPSHEEIKEEFKNRKDTLDAKRMQVDADYPEGEVHPTIFTDHTLHRGIEDDIEDDEGGALSEKEEVIYVPEFKRYTQFFSTSDIETLYETLALYVSNMTKEFEFSPITYSATLKISQDDNEVSMTVNILKVEGEDIHCIEAVKNSGNRFIFSDIYNKMKQFFGGHVNASEPI